MSTTERPLILLTNDDGIRSPGLWAAAEALSELGFVMVVAPREQSSGAGRSVPSSSDGVIREEHVQVGGKNWKVYAVGGTPAQAVLHAVLEVLPRHPDVLVAGINYGENAGLGVTVSGTVGAALEGGAQGIPSLAMSLETDIRQHLSYSSEVDFSAAAHFTKLFAGMLLAGDPIAGVDVLKVEVPSDATTNTPWRVSRLSRTRYYTPVRPERHRLDEPATVGYRLAVDDAPLEPDSDAYVLRVARQVSVTPLTLDMTSRVDLPGLEDLLRRRSAPRSLSE